MRTVLGAFILFVAACGAVTDSAAPESSESTSLSTEVTSSAVGNGSGEAPEAVAGPDAEESDAGDSDADDSDAGESGAGELGAGEPGAGEPDAGSAGGTEETTSGTVTDSTAGSNPAGDEDTPSDASIPAFSRAAVVGCSQTRDAVFGYNEVATDGRFGPSAAAQYLGGGSIEAWANPASRYWRDFDELAGPDNDAIWLMICWHSARSVDADVEMVAAVIDRAIETIGREVPVYVSGLNDWDPRSLCTRGDFPASVELADAVVAAELALRGPDLGPLLREHTDDGCHGNRAGNALMGGQLVEFFGP